MNESLYSLDISQLDDINAEIKQAALNELETGKVIYCPSYSFILDEHETSLLSEDVLDKKHKNISFDCKTKRLGGLATDNNSSVSKPTMQQFMHRYADFSQQLIEMLLPQYKTSLRLGRTSYRPAEIKGRQTSKRKDDTRLHVDSFPATPVHGQRILRVFCNINPFGAPREWNLGEPFSQVLARFSPTIPNYNPVKARLLKWVKATKTLRSPYDHYMLNLHDLMKCDDEYQQNVAKQSIAFPPNSTWIVFTDQTSHAALSGQYLLEQTFYLPVQAMSNPALSPLKQWEQDRSCSFM